jgi:CO/xanthine dehydrogenase FAD-binding subunit
MRDFVYRRPASLDEACRLAGEEGAMLLAGGQTLLRDMKHGLHSPASLVDIIGIVPRQIEFVMARSRSERVRRTPKSPATPFCRGICLSWQPW